MTRRIILRGLNAWMLLLVSCLASDLLYLYYEHAWNDPISYVEHLEVVLLWLLVAAGIAGTWWQIRHLTSNEKILS